MEKIQCGRGSNPVVYEEGFGTTNTEHYEYEWECGCRLSTDYIHGQKFTSCGKHEVHPPFNRVEEHIVPQKIKISGNTFRPYCTEGDCLIFDSEFVHNKLRRRIEEGLRKNAGTGQLINIALYLGIQLD